MVLKEYAAIDIETKDGKTYSVDESGIIRDSLTTSSSCSSSGGIPAGSCNAGTISVSFRPPAGLTYSKLAKAKVHLYVWYENNSKTKVGVYNVTSAENNYGIYTVSGSDNVGLLDDGCYSAVDTENAQNWLFTVLSGKFKPVSVIFNQICNAYGVPHYNASENEKIIPESGNTMLCTCVSEECSIESVKDFANYMAEYLGCFIVPAPDGRLRFCRFGDRKCGVELNETNIQRGSYQRSPYYAAPTIWKIGFDSGFGGWWRRTTDTPDNAAPLSVNLTNNPFWQAQEDMIPNQYGGKVTQMIKYMWSYICDAAYADDGNPCFNPFRCTVFVQYYFRVGDMVTIIDPFTGKKFKSYVTDVTWTFRGGQQISFAGEDTRTLSVSTNRNAAKKANDYSKYLYRKSKNGSGENVNTKYALSKSGHTITLTGSDGTVYNVTDDDTIYTHPSHTSHAKGFYKFANNSEGHVTDAVNVTKADIMALGIPDDEKLDGKQDKSTAVTHTANTAVGSATKPVYVAANGAATAITHSINADVPANAKFTDTTYSDATQSAHGLMSAADKKKLDGMDLSKYLPLAGGAMTGDIDLASNGVDLLVGSQRAKQTTYATAVAGATISTKQTFSSGLPERKSLVGSFLDQNSVWHSIISVRHRNGYNDGVNYGIYLRSLLTSDGSLIWNKQTGAGKWQGERVLLDSSNYSTYAAKSDHTHDAITNSSRWASGANNAAQWVRLGTVVSSGNFATTVISVWSGDGANGNASQNSWFDIHIKDGWQSTESATKACGVTVYRTRCGTVKVKVLPTAHNTYTVWVYLPWAYWNGNYSVHGKYSSWTPQGLKQTAEPDGTAADTAYYDQAFLTSTVANATTWDGLINDVDTYNSSDTWILVKKDNRIQHRYAGELDVNSAKTLVDSGWQKPTFPSGVKSSSIRYRKQGKIVSVTGYVQFSTAQTTITVFTLPTGYRPPAKIQQFNAVDSSAQASFLTKIDTDGKVGFFGKTQGFFTTATEYYIHCTFFVD